MTFVRETVDAAKETLWGKRDIYAKAPQEHLRAVFGRLNPIQGIPAPTDAMTCVDCVIQLMFRELDDAKGLTVFEALARGQFDGRPRDAFRRKVEEIVTKGDRLFAAVPADAPERWYAARRGVRGGFVLSEPVKSARDVDAVLNSDQSLYYEGLAVQERDGVRRLYRGVQMANHSWQYRTNGELVVDVEHE